MSQLLIPFGNWIITNKGNQDCRVLADRHYSRQSPGNVQFCRPGRNLVLISPSADAVWVTWDGIRDDGFTAWECTLFRNEGQVLSSILINEAIAVTVQEWGNSPPDGIITYVNSARVKSNNPGCCFKKAGWKHAGKSKSGLLRFQYRHPSKEGD